MNDLEGFDELINGMEHLAKELPGTGLTKAVKKGAAILLNATKSAAPIRTGTLRSGLILHKERSRTPGKVVYDIYPDPQKNAIFQKTIKNPVRSKTPYGYYPASQEYGFFTRRPGGGMIYTRSDGQIANIDKVPGKHYMLKGAEVSGEAAKSTIAGSLLSDIEREFGG